MISNIAGVNHLLLRGEFLTAVKGKKGLLVTPGMLIRS